MSSVGFRARNHPQQVRARGDAVLFDDLTMESTDDVDDRATHPHLFESLHKRFGFTVDVAASTENAKCRRFYTLADDGLRQSWAGEVVWCNPPFSRIRPWVEKAWVETAATIVMLVPNNRTEQRWWQDLIEPHRDRADRLSVEFLAGRPRFAQRGRSTIGPNERPPFGLALLIWRPAE